MFEKRWCLCSFIAFLCLNDWTMLCCKCTGLFKSRLDVIHQFIYSCKNNQYDCHLIESSCWCFSHCHNENPFNLLHISSVLVLMGLTPPCAGSPDRLSWIMTHLMFNLRWSLGKPEISTDLLILWSLDVIFLFLNQRNEWLGFNEKIHISLFPPKSGSDLDSLLGHHKIICPQM